MADEAAKPQTSPFNMPGCDKHTPMQAMRVPKCLDRVVQSKPQKNHARRLRLDRVVQSKPPNTNKQHASSGRAIYTSKNNKYSDSAV